MSLGLAALLLFAPAAAKAEWRQATTDHFIIYSEDSPKDLEAFATKLERFDRAMRVLLDLPDLKVSPANRLTIFVVSNLQQVRKLYGKGKASSSVAGFYMARATGSYAITPRATGPGDQYSINEQIILLHEYAHHFMLGNFVGAFPAWLVEGYAEFNSTATFEKDGSVGIGLPANHRAYSLLGNSPLKIEKLLTASVGELSDPERDSLYGRGWLLTHYLTFEPSRRGQLRTYLAEINKGTKGLDAAKKAFGDLEELDRELNKYLYRRSLYYHKFGPDRIKIGRIEMRTLTPGEAAVMDVRIRSKRGVDQTQAKALVPLARKAAAAFPNDVLAQTTLAEAEYDAGNFAEAEAAADRALKTDANAVEALIYKGRARMAVALKAEKKDPQTWREVRRWFLAANKIEPEDPEPLLLFYTSFGAAGAEPTANASLGLERALELAPQDPSLRWMVAHQKLRDDKASEARAALAPVAFSPHQGEEAQAAAKIIAAIDEGGAKAGLEAFERLGKDVESKS